MNETVSGEFLPPVYPSSEDGQYKLLTADKNGAVQGTQETEGESKGWMPAICGSVVGAEIAAAFTLTEDEQMVRWNSLRHDSPWEMMGWALAAHEAVGPLSEILGPDSGRRTVFEARMYPADSAAEALLKVGTLLEMEKDLPEDSEKPVADALRRGLLIGNPGEVVGMPADYMQRLLRRARPENGLEDLVYTMRTHHEMGDLVMAQKARADFINLTFEQGDSPDQLYVQQVADMFKTVLGTNKSCDPEALNKFAMQYVDQNGELLYMRGPEIVHNAAALILSGKLKMQIGEIKSMTLIGEQYEGFEKGYRHSDYNLQRFFSKYMMGKPANRELRRNLYYKYEYDIAKTSLAAWNLFRIAENEYHTQPHTFRGQADLFPGSDARQQDGLPDSYIDPTLVMREVEKVVVPIKFDIRANGRHVPRKDFDVVEGGHVVPKEEGEVDASVDPKPSYRPVPSLSDLGVPEDVDVAHWSVSSSRVESLWKLWAWELSEPEAAQDREAFIEKVIARMRRVGVVKDFETVA